MVKKILLEIHLGKLYNSFYFILLTNLINNICKLQCMCPITCSWVAFSMGSCMSVYILCNALKPPGKLYISSKTQFISQVTDNDETYKGYNLYLP